MDQDMDGSVTFEEYLVVMSMLSRGSLDEKLQWVFNLYDSNGDGQLTTDKLTIVATSVYEMLGSCTNPPWIQDNTIEDHVTRVFSVRTSTGPKYEPLRQRALLAIQKGLRTLYSNALYQSGSY